jgi:carbamoyltransferase
MLILGVSSMHDSSVAVVENGRVKDFYKEERFTGIKRDMYPWKSLDIVKNQYANNIDHIVVANPFYNNYDSYLSTYLSKTYSKDVLSLSHMHHQQHAALAFYNSGFKKSVVIIIDRNGSYVKGKGHECETVLVAEYPNVFKTLHKQYWDNDNLGIVKVYESATTLIGQHPLENGKTMGLSSYGKPSNSDNLFYEDGTVKNHLFGISSIDNFDTTVSILKKDKNKKINKVTEDDYQPYADYAYEVQKQTQEQVLKLIKRFTKETGIKNVCITGGYGLNVIANNYYLENCEDINFYFEPIADDSGNSIGAAMNVYRDISLDNNIYPLKDTFFHGFNYEINLDIPHVSYADIVEALLSQKTVGVFYGKSEAGPRALGNRSILFDPRNIDGKKIVNKIKNREWYRPFGAVMLEEEFEKYFHTNGDAKNEYMTVAYKCKDSVSSMIPSVVHVDNTCRLQTVSKGHIYEVLKEFKKHTGIGILLNTSFNTAGMPLVEDPNDAVDILRSTDLDALWFPSDNAFNQKLMF